MRMFHALLVCSESECGELFEAFGPYEELDSLACECGCGLMVLAWPTPIEEESSSALELYQLSAR
jgi:hypothetical protein